MPKEWVKKVMKWDNDISGWKTNIPVTDLEGCDNHVIKYMKAVSVDGGGSQYAVLTFNVIRGVIGPTTKRDEIVETLQRLTTERRKVFVYDSEFGSNFKITFQVGRFCEDVLQFMREFFVLFAINDPTGHWLADFTITRETLIAQGEGWIKFEDYFKMVNGLRLHQIRVENMPRLDGI